MEPIAPVARIVPGKFAANFAEVPFAFNIFTVVTASAAIAPASTALSASSEAPIAFGAI